MVLDYVVFEGVAIFLGRLGLGYPQYVTKLPEEGLAVGPLGSAGRGPPGNERFGTLRRHGPEDMGRGWVGASVAAKSIGAKRRKKGAKGVAAGGVFAIFAGPP
jgi:hypothetical protein